MVVTVIRPQMRHSILGYEKHLLVLVRQAKLAAYGSSYDVRMPLTIAGHRESD